MDRQGHNEKQKRDLIQLSFVSVMIFSMFHTLLLIGFSIFYCRVSCDVRLTLVVGDMLVSRKAHIICEAGWHRDDYSSLAESYLLWFCQGLFFSKDRRMEDVCIADRRSADEQGKSLPCSIRAEDN